MRKFYDLVRFHDPEPLDFSRVFTPRDYRFIPPDRSERKRVEKEGKIPISLADSDESWKKAVRIGGVVYLVPRAKVVDVGGARLLAERGAALILLSDYLNSPSRALKYGMFQVRVLRKRGVPILLATGARNPLEQRRAREVASFGTLLGIPYPEALNGVSRAWGGFFQV